MTLKQKIIDLFNLPLFESGCVYVCQVIVDSDRQKRYSQQDWVRLNASVSSQLCKFVKSGFLEVVPATKEFGPKSPRGGQVYRKTKRDEVKITYTEEETKSLAEKAWNTPALPGITFEEWWATNKKK